VAVLRLPHAGQPLQPAPDNWVTAPLRWGWPVPGGMFTTGLLVEKTPTEFIWEPFICKDGVFSAGPDGFRYTMEIVENK
jgi:hypothetical protein